MFDDKRLQVKVGWGKTFFKFWMSQFFSFNHLLGGVNIYKELSKPLCKEVSLCRLNFTLERENIWSY